MSGVHYQNVADWNDYLTSLADKRLPLGRAYTPSALQSMIRQLILLLKRGYVEISYFNEKFGRDIWQEYQTVWQQYIQAGWVVRNGDRIELTMEGLLRVDGLLPAFFEEEFRGVRYT
jgi:oxygen-independent coproporphyrinogen-3 oxidase